MRDDVDWKRVEFSLRSVPRSRRFWVGLRPGRLNPHDYSRYPQGMNMQTCWTIFWLAFFSLPNRGAGEDAKPIHFEKQIRPILTSRCGECHGPKNQNSELRLDARDAALKGGVSGKVIVPGKSSESELIRRIDSPDEARANASGGQAAVQSGNRICSNAGSIPEPTGPKQSTIGRPSEILDVITGRFNRFAKSSPQRCPVQIPFESPIDRSFAENSKTTG